MSTEQNSPTNGSADQAPAGQAEDSLICVVTALPEMRLFWAKNEFGEKGDALPGYVIACPQSCAKGRPGYNEVSKTDLKKIYLNTTEWIREIIYTEDYKAVVDPVTLGQKFREYRKRLGFARVSNDAKAGGCGHISRHVEVTKVHLLGSGVLEETPHAGLYSSLAIGKAQGPVYLADTIYIYQGDWKLQYGFPIHHAVDEIVNGRRPIDVSGCE